MNHLFRRAVVVPLAVGSASLLYLLRFPRPPRNGPRDSDHEMFRHARAEYLAQMPTNQLLRSLFVHSFCSHPHLVDFGMWVMKSPSLQNPVFDSIIRNTFFAEFCGGETRHDAINLAQHLKTRGLVPLLGYSKEFSDSIPEMQATEDEIVACIQDLKSFPKPAFVAIKLSGLSPEAELRRLEMDVDNVISNIPRGSSQFPEAQIRILRDRHAQFFSRLTRISRAASDSGISLIVDAEIRYQGNVDSLPTSAILCSVLNSSKPHVWNTHQMLFRDGLSQIERWSSKNPIKLVRGAYLLKEPPEAVAGSKEETDEMYNNTVTHLIQNRTNALLIASHNHHSILNAFQLVQSGKVAHGRNIRTICFGQLHGMGNDITYGLVHGLNKSSIPSFVQVSVVKYIPYGGLRDVMPYLVRRAEENRGMLSGSILEREALFGELKRRTREFLGLGLTFG